MGCGDSYRGDGCLARSVHGVLDLVTTLAVVAIIIINAFYLSVPLADDEPSCYLDGVNGYGSLSVCMSVYIVAAVSFGILVATNVLHCCACCSSVLSFLVEALSEAAQAALWVSASVQWHSYATPSVVDPDAPLEWEAQYYDLAALRSIVLDLAFLIAACQLVQAAIASYRFVCACCCGKEDSSSKNNKLGSRV